MVDLEKKVDETLQGLDLQTPEIDVYRMGSSIFATIISSSFTGMAEAERQRRVWEALRASLGEAERATIEFVFTIAPEEKEPAEEAM